MTDAATGRLGDPTDHLDEQATIGAMMWGHTPTIVEHLRASDFHDTRHSLIYAYLIAAWAANQPTDPIAIAGALRDAGELRRAGGLPYLHTLYHTGATATDPLWHAHRVANNADARNTHTLALRLADYATIPDPDRRRQLVTQAITTHTAPHASLNGHHTAPIDWAEFLGAQPEPPRWLAGKLLCHGEQVALVGDGKAGKSLLAQEWAWRAAAGKPFLGDVARPPLRVLYLDQENSPDELRERMHSYGATPQTLMNLTYLSFPPFQPLNTAAGAAGLLRVVDHHDPDLIFLDTISRMIDGIENDADTWLALYRHLIVPLKAAGRACVRLDHFGKDATRGSRGSSAKTQDVDHVWELTSAGGGYLQLSRTHTRTGHGEEAYTVHRLSDRDERGWRPGTTRHVLAATQGTAPMAKAVQDIIARLDKEGIADEAGRDAIRAACIKLNIRASNETLHSVVRFRRARLAKGDM